jgi:pimeloyl-ACP methyl ester carboxylesterase
MHVKQTVALVAFAIAAGPLSAQQAEPRGEGDSLVETRMVEVGGHPVRVQTAGWHHRVSGRPVVVLENGAGVPVEAWQPILAAVAEFTPVLAYDRAGIGQSPWDEQRPTPEHVNGKLRALLAGPHASLIVAAHARHYIMGDDPQLVIDAIRRVSAAVSATPREH